MPDDEVKREKDPAASRRAALAGAVTLAVLAALAGGFWLGRSATAPPVAGGPPVRTTPPAGEAPAPTPTPAPTPVPGIPVLGAAFSAAEDGAVRELVVFGGVDSFADTWTWDGRRWALARPALRPPGRFRASMAYDPATRLVMLYGGVGPGQEPLHDTWAWDGGTWRELDSGTGSGQPAGQGSLLAWDDERGAMVLISANSGGTPGTWTWGGTGWVRDPAGDLPAGTYPVAAATDQLTRSLVMVSCCAEGTGAAGTFVRTNAGWEPAGGPEPGFAVTMALDPMSGRLLLCEDPSLSGGDEMWSWDGRRWNLLSGDRLPVFPSAEVSDPAGHVVIAGSFAEPVLGSPKPVHLWSWTGTAWSQTE